MSSESQLHGDQFTPEDFGLVYPITEHNAGRSCGTCQDPASVYLFIDGVISTFRCREHMPAAVKDDLDSETEVQP